MAKAEQKRALILKSFTDAGTGERFKAGTTQPIAAGAYANYKAAGLVRASRAKSPDPVQPPSGATEETAPSAE